MTPDAMKLLIDDMYLLSATDMDKALELYVHDEFFIEEADELPMAGRYEGREGLRKLYAEVFQMVEISGLERTHFMAGEDCCANRVVFQFADESLEPAELMEFFRFKDGKIIEIRPYYFSPGTFTRAADAKG